MKTRPWHSLLQPNSILCTMILTTFYLRTKAFYQPFSFRCGCLFISAIFFFPIFGLPFLHAESATARSPLKQSPLPATHADSTSCSERSSFSGSLSGRVLWKGPLPELEPFHINQNTTLCCQGKNRCYSADGKQWRPSDRLLIETSTRGVSNAIVFLENMEGRGKALSTLRSNARLHQRRCEFLPHILLVAQGAALQLTSADRTQHNTHMYGSASYNLSFAGPQTRYVRPFRRPGIARVVCDAGHGWMTAYIHVVEHPYYTRTARNGRFLLDEIPAGTYKLVMWHEGWTVVPPPGSPDVEVDNTTNNRLHFTEPILLSQTVSITNKLSAGLVFELSKDVAQQFQKAEVSQKTQN